VKEANRWRAGWAAGTGVVLVAAGLLLELIARGGRIAEQADEIAATLERASENAAALFALTDTNAKLAAATAELARLRERGSGS